MFRYLATKHLSALIQLQKYIENTLVMKNRKFDIRQWVLVTDWNPLTIWLYAEPYIRFPAADFSFDNLTNRYSHLSNNSIAKYGKVVNNMHQIPGNMWSLRLTLFYFYQAVSLGKPQESTETIQNCLTTSAQVI